MTESEISLAIVAAKAILDYDRANPDVGWGMGRETALNHVQKHSGVQLDIPAILNEWDADEKFETESRKICSVCGQPMVKRINKKTQKEFYGCSAFPKCRGPRKDKHQTSINNYLDYCCDEHEDGLGFDFF